MSIEETARSHAQMAIATLAEICADELALPAARMAAARELLDRGYGKPLSAVVSVPAPTTARIQQLAAMSEQQLLAIVGRGRIIDVTPDTPQSPVPISTHGKSLGKLDAANENPNPERKMANAINPTNENPNPERKMANAINSGLLAHAIPPLDDRDLDPDLEVDENGNIVDPLAL